jgi:uncharacterized coiled-coil DUF342 family protein
MEDLGENDSQVLRKIERLREENERLRQEVFDALQALNDALNSRDEAVRQVLARDSEVERLRAERGALQAVVVEVNAVLTTMSEEEWPIKRLAARLLRLRTLLARQALKEVQR